MEWFCCYDWIISLDFQSLCFQISFPLCLSQTLLCGGMLKMKIYGGSNTAVKLPTCLSRFLGQNASVVFLTFLFKASPAFFFLNIIWTCSANKLKIGGVFVKFLILNFLYCIPSCCLKGAMLSVILLLLILEAEDRTWWACSHKYCRK